MPIKEFDFLKTFHQNKHKTNLPNIYQEIIATLYKLREKQKRREHFPIHHMKPASPTFQNQTDVIRK